MNSKIIPCANSEKKTGLQITRLLFSYSVFLLLFLNLSLQAIAAPSHKAPAEKQSIKALYIPLADHYAALVAYEKYGSQMQFADFQIRQMKNWDFLRAYFQAEQVDMAFVMTPLAIDMFTEKPHFRWVSLMHRDGNALAINDVLYRQISLPSDRLDRKPDDQLARVLKTLYLENKRSIEIGMPHLLSTHSVVLYRYLKEHGLSLSLHYNAPAEVQAVTVAPPKSPAFIKAKSSRAMGAAFEQSLPWADIVETGGYGHVAWYSKDVMPWKNGHVECIALATDKAIATKEKALNEVIAFIHQAGQDIETARNSGGEKLEAIVRVIRKHIPMHTREAIIASLNPTLKVINYQQLDIDKAGLKQIMEFAVEGGILTRSINIDEFADTRFMQSPLPKTVPVSAPITEQQQ